MSEHAFISGFSHVLCTQSWYYTRVDYLYYLLLEDFHFSIFAFGISIHEISWKIHDDFQILKYLAVIQLAIYIHISHSNIS